MDTLKKIYYSEAVDDFFRQMGNNQPKEKMDNFIKYHNEEVLLKFMQLFPPPSIWELWNRWNR